MVAIVSARRRVRAISRGRVAGSPRFRAGSCTNRPRFPISFRRKAPGCVAMRRAARRFTAESPCSCGWQGNSRLGGNYGCLPAGTVVGSGGQVPRPAPRLPAGETTDPFVPAARAALGKPPPFSATLIRASKAQVASTGGSKGVPIIAQPALALAGSSGGLPGGGKPRAARRCGGPERRAAGVSGRRPAPCGHAGSRRSGRRTWT